MAILNQCLVSVSKQVEIKSGQGRGSSGRETCQRDLMHFYSLLGGFILPLKCEI